MMSTALMLGLVLSTRRLRLRDMLNEFRHARIVVSYYDCGRVREVYEGWRFVKCGRQKNLARQNKAQTKSGEAPEVLIVNGASMRPT